jgi:hypothetical protein
VALAAAVGLTTLDVRRRVRVALFSTGDDHLADRDRWARRAWRRRDDGRGGLDRRLSVLCDADGLNWRARFARLTARRMPRPPARYSG